MADKYRFRLPVDEFEIYPDGTEVPRRFSMIERQRDDGRWHVVGFAEVQVVKISRGEGGLEDLSVGFFGLVNPAEPDAAQTTAHDPRGEPVAAT